MALDHEGRLVKAKVCQNLPVTFLS